MPEEKPRDKSYCVDELAEVFILLIYSRLIGSPSTCIMPILTDLNCYQSKWTPTQEHVPSGLSAFTSSPFSVFFKRPFIKCPKTSHETTHIAWMNQLKYSQGSYIHV